MPDKRQIAAILFTDIEGYISLMRRDEEQTIAIKNRHLEVLQNLHKQFDGQITEQKTLQQ